jgi:hypothetical protein
MMPLCLQEVRHLAVFNDLPLGNDGVRIGQVLNARRNVDCLTEVFLTLIQHDRKARPFMNVDLERQILIRLDHPSPRASARLPRRHGRAFGKLPSRRQRC